MTDERSNCPTCGEWRDAPWSDCGNCGYLAVCRCGHDHLDPPWREGDEGICNATMGALICGCREFWAAA